MGLAIRLRKNCGMKNSWAMALCTVCLTSTGVARGTDIARPSWLPADATAVAPCVEALGDIYWNPKRLPFGPTYGVHDGKPVFEEVMISQRDFEKGFDLNDVGKPVPPFPVDHIDIWFAPHGHDGFPSPHYDIMLVFMPHAEHMHLCGNKSGAMPDFVLQSGG